MFFKIQRKESDVMPALLAQAEVIGTRACDWSHTKSALVHTGSSTNCTLQMDVFDFFLANLSFVTVPMSL